MVGDMESIHDLIKNQNYDPNQKMTDWFDSEPLGWAASFGRLDIVILLIKLGANPLLPPNKAKNTPLSDAIREGHQKVVDFLRQYESRVKDINKYIKSKRRNLRD
jgi:ankyrin repeat protein